MAAMSDSKDDSYPTRSSLIRRVKDTGDHQSWQEFHDFYGKLILGFASKAGLTEDEAREVVQETLIAAAKHLPQFRYDPKVCSFKTWLLNVSAWRVRDQLRKRRRPTAPQSGLAPANAEEDTRRTATVERIPDPAGSPFEAIWDSEWQTTLIDAALARVKTRVDAKQWQIFDLAALKDWSVKDVVKSLGVSAARVYLVKHRISAAVAKEAKHLERQLEHTTANPETPRRPPMER
jgi:RNA polymerase sigma-70 factor (ECF subfamily)